MKLDFIYIGPDKSGSTWLFNIFKQHKKIFVPDAKDIYFFDRYYNKGFKWYENFFKESTQSQIVGEISHDYMFNSEAINKIIKQYPNIKLFTVLRNPFEKIWSQYLFLIRSGVTNKPFKDAIKEHDDLLEKCLYGKYLSMYYNMESKNIKILLFDDLKKEPKIFAERIFQFLNVGFQENIDYYEKTLPASKPNSFFIAKMAKKSAIILRELGLVNLLGKIKSNKFINKILYKPYTKENKPKMTQEDFEFIYSILLDDIEKLENLIGLDLENWKNHKVKDESRTK